MAGRELRERAAALLTGSLTTPAWPRLVPYLAVIGGREAAAGQVALRLRDGRRLAPRPAADVLADIGARAGAHGTALWADGEPA